MLTWNRMKSCYNKQNQDEILKMKILSYSRRGLTSYSESGSAKKSPDVADFNFLHVFAT